MVKLVVGRVMNTWLILNYPLETILIK